MAFPGAHGQETIRITARFEQRTLPDILAEVRRQTGVRFFYRAEDLPQAPMSINLDNTPLPDALIQLLRGTTLDFMLYRRYAGIIAPREVLQEAYSSSYYQALAQSLSAGESPPGSQTIPIGDIRRLKPSGLATVRGTVRTEEGDPAPGASIEVKALKKSAVSDERGTFELVLPAGKHVLLIKYIGTADMEKEIQVFSDGTLALEVQNPSVNLDEVVISGQGADANVGQAQIGVARLDLKAVSKLPSFLGEVDIVKSLLLLPGVSSIGESATGFNVRGGEVDQNLVMQDGGIIFNSSHALGFFSTFHPDLIRNVTLYKSILPAQYGGRLASVLDVEMRDGSFDRFRIKGSVGLVSSRISVEGPVVPKKSSFIAGFRSSYSDWILGAVRNLEVRNSSVFFYDANLRYTHRLNERNLLTLSGYASKDAFTYNEAFGFDYQTLMAQTGYKKTFSERLLSNLTATWSRYKSTQFDYASVNASRLDNAINYIKVQENLTFLPRNGVQWNAGLSAISYLAEPGARSSLGELSGINPKKLDQERGLEAAAYLNGDWTVSPALQITGGLRLGAYLFFGGRPVFGYQDPAFPVLEQIIDTTFYARGTVIASYGSLEPRFSARYRLNPDASVKAGYSRTAQFINQIFNTDSPLPTSQFQLSTSYIEPTRSHNVSIGYFQNLNNNLWETSVEVYGRAIDALFDYKDFAELNVNEHLETELLKGIGRAYGMEFSLRKTRGTWNGFLSYTFSRTERQIEGINNGAWYPSNFDKPHDLSLVVNYQYNQRHSLTFNFAYGTGRPATAPVGVYSSIGNLRIPIYTDRNALRIPDYHRLDISYTLGQGYRKDRPYKTSWTFSLYNVYARRNPFSVFFTRTPTSSVQANRLAILGTIFPALTFNFEML